MIVYALGETWFAVFGGLIPIIGLAGIAAILYRAIGPNDANDNDPTNSEEASSPEEDRDRQG